MGQFDLGDDRSIRLGDMTDRQFDTGNERAI
jgi:hypothetical protein